jgi:hypothetical protein
MINQRSAQAPIRTIPRKIGGLLSIHPSWAPTKLDPHTNNPHVKTSSTISGPLIYLDSHSFMGVSISIAFDRTLGGTFLALIIGAQFGTLPRKIGALTSPSVHPS